MYRYVSTLQLTGSLFYLGNLYIADEYNHRIRKVTVSTGIVTTIAGNGSTGYSGDNGQASSASLYNPFGVAVDAVGTQSSLLYSQYHLLTNPSSR